MSIICQTPRLTIRHLSHHDAQFIVALLNEPSFIENIADKGVRSLDDAVAYLNTGPMMSYQINGFGLNLVTLTDNQQPIGVCGLLKRPELAVPDLGYAYLPEFWGEGYAKESAHAVLTDAKQRLHLTHIAAITHMNNEASMHLLKKLGFKFINTVILTPGEAESRYFEFNQVK
ncbi:GNAT family N-acetyltransferase [Thalassotalea piscium]